MLGLIRAQTFVSGMLFRVRAIVMARTSDGTHRSSDA